MLKRKLALFATIDLGARNAPAIHVLNLAKNLSAIGYDVTIMAPSFRGTLPVELPKKGVELVLSANMCHWHLPNSLNTLMQIPYLFRHRGSALYLRSSPLSFPVTLMAKWLGFSPVVIETNGWFSDELKALGVNPFISGAFDFLQSREACRADGVRVVTTRLGRLLENRRVSAEKIVVIENGADTDVFFPLERKQCLVRLKLDKNKRYIAFVGNLWPPVDMETVFAAMQKTGNAKRKIVLLIAGDGRSIDHFKSLARKFQVSNKVHFLGSLEQTELKYVLGAADIAIAPLHAKRNERIGVSPLKLYEYAASGTPVVATRLSGIFNFSEADWISLVAPGDVKGWRQTIDRLLSKDDLEELSKQARAFAEKEFDWRKRAEQIDALIQKSEMLVARRGKV